jgi:hypothetical protein
MWGDVLRSRSKYAALYRCSLLCHKLNPLLVRAENLGTSLARKLLDDSGACLSRFPVTERGATVDAGSVTLFNVLV